MQFLGGIIESARCIWKSVKRLDFHQPKLRDTNTYYRSEIEDPYKMASNADAAFMSELEALGKYESLQAEVKLRQELRLSLASPQLLQQSRANHNANKKSLKSDVKKTSMFVNKLRSINSEGLTQCIRDVETLNLTLYISEIVNALLEISFKPNDVPSIVKLAVSLHKRYDDFSPPFLEKLKSSTLLLTSPQQTANTGSSNTDDNQNQKKKRIQIRLLIELFEVGVFTEEDFFVQLLRQLLGKTKAEYVLIFDSSQ